MNIILSYHGSSNKYMNNTYIDIFFLYKYHVNSIIYMLIRVYIYLYILIYKYIR